MWVYACEKTTHKDSYIGVEVVIQGEKERGKGWLMDKIC